MKFISVLIKIITYPIGIILIVLGQGLLIFTSITAFLSYLLTALMFFGAVMLTFVSDPPTPTHIKIFAWFVAVMLGFISANIASIPDYLISAGSYIINRK